jgi:gas vesicle protein
MKKSGLTLGVIIGAAAGIIAGLLTAPKSGKETRQDIKNHAEEMKRTGTEKLDHIEEEVKRTVDKAPFRNND